MFSPSIHLYSSRTALDHLGRECFTRYIIDPYPLMYIFYRSYDILMSVSWLRTIPLCGVAGPLKIIRDFTSLLNPWGILIIICCWEILRVVLVRSRLILHTTKSYSSPIDLVAYFSWCIQSYVSILSCSRFPYIFHKIVWQKWTVFGVHTSYIY